MPDSRLRGLGGAVLGTVVLGTACWSPLKEPDDGVGGATSTTVAIATTGATSNTGTATSVASSSSTGEPPLPDDEPPPYLFERCPQASAWSLACLTITGMAVAAFNPETSESCVVTPLGEDPIYTGSFALVGDAIIVCDEAADRTLKRIDALTGDVEATTLECDAVTDASDELYVLSLVTLPADVVSAPTFEDYVRGNVAETDVAPDATRIVARNADLYASLHVADTLEHWDLSTQTQVGTITLQDFDEAVMGIAPLDDGRIVVLTSSDVVVFSPTGARLSVGKKPSALASGLRCYTP